MSAFKELKSDLQAHVTFDELMQDVTSVIVGMLKFYHTSDPKAVGDIICNPDGDNWNAEDWYYELMIKAGLLDPIDVATGRMTPKFEEFYQKLVEEGYYEKLEEAHRRKIAGE